MRERTQSEGLPVPASSEREFRLRDYVQILLATILVGLFLKTCVIGAYRIPSASMENTLRVGDFLLANKFIYGIQTPHYLPFTDIELPRLRLPAFRSPQRGDILVFEFPEHAHEQPRLSAANFVKRCIGIPGDTITIIDRRIHVNGSELEFPAEAKFGREYILPKKFGDSRIFPRGSKFNEDNYGPLVVPMKGEHVQLSRGSFLTWKHVIEHEGHAAQLDREGNVLIDGVPQKSYTMKQDYYFVVGDNRGNSLDSRFWGFVPDDLIIGKVMLVYWSWEEGIGDGFVERLQRIRWDRVGKIVR
ncbi:MAG: signal peptidase I [Ignavibacteriae bacterium]|nr:signal peptidase I [Ignavibacteriota bacterium]